MSDLIDRQAAMTALQKAYMDTEEGKNKKYCWINVGITKALHKIQDMPSARKTGKWMINTDGRAHYVFCSECGNGYMVARKWNPFREVFEEPKTSNYCPNCGAKMEVEHE